MGYATSDDFTYDTTQLADLDEKYLTFLSDRQLYGIPICQVMIISGMQPIISIPESAPYVKGVVNLGGRIVPLIDLRLRFGKEELAHTERTCIIVTHFDEKTVGFIVDEVNEVTDIKPEYISPPPVTGDSCHEYLTGVAKLQDTVILLLTAPKLLSEEMLSRLTENQ